MLKTLLITAPDYVAPITHDPSEQLGVLAGAACGAVIGLVVAIAAIVYFVRKSRATLPSTFAPCPQCRSTMAKPAGYTWWGGLLGPKLLTHVICASCGTAFNGKTGRSNTAGIAIYVVTTFTLVFGILAIGVAVMSS